MLGRKCAKPDATRTTPYLGARYEDRDGGEPTSYSVDLAKVPNSIDGANEDFLKQIRNFLISAQRRSQGAAHLGGVLVVEDCGCARVTGAQSLKQRLVITNEC
jgi:hypothetical protein